MIHDRNALGFFVTVNVLTNECNNQSEKIYVYKTLKNLLKIKIENSNFTAWAAIKFYSHSAEKYADTED